MTERVSQFEPDWVSPPGDTILDLLEEKNWSQAELATRTGFTRKHINELVSGKATLTPVTALKLEGTVGGPARFWLAREAQYREALARADADRELARESEWLRGLPVTDMIRLGWIKALRGTAARVRECLRFFGVASVAAWRERYAQPLAAFRKSSKVASNTGAIAAWLRQGEREAEALVCEPFNDGGFRRALRALREITQQTDPPEFLPRLVEICAANGVAVVFVPTPRGCPVSGATRWLAPNKAALQLSLRYKTNDHLWFTIFHEAGHLLLHGKRLMFLEGADAVSQQQEEEANRFARDALIPPAEAAKLPLLGASHDAVRDFAARLGVAPGIIVGRMQHERLIEWSQLNDLKVRYDWAPEPKTCEDAS
jgi:plasmid maintenance system antidote protein VapI